MHNNHPIRLTPAEWAEIAALAQVQQAWGLPIDASPQDVAELIYGVKFDFVSGGPGYVGDLYILQGDAAGEPPMVLGRDAKRHLMVL
jgi:hypothetical protein